MAKGFTRAEIRNILGDAHSDEVENALIALHIGVVDQIKDERDKYKADADKLEGVQAELDKLKGLEGIQAKYDKEHEAFEAYKKQVVKDAEDAKIKAAFRKLLTEEKINEKRLDGIIRLTDFSKMKLDKDGNLADVDALKKSIGDEWGEYRTTTQERGADVATPPHTDNGGKPMSRAAELAAQYHKEKYGVRSENK